MEIDRASRQRSGMGYDALREIERVGGGVERPPSCRPPGCAGFLGQPIQLQRRTVDHRCRNPTWAHAQGLDQQFDCASGGVSGESPRRFTMISASIPASQSAAQQRSPVPLRQLAGVQTTCSEASRRSGDMIIVRGDPDFETPPTAQAAPNCAG